MNNVSEKVYYQSKDVLITSTRAEMSGKTFVMANITSVSLSKSSSNHGCVNPLGFVLLAIAVVSHGNGSDGVSFITVLLFLGGLSLIVINLSRMFTSKPTYKYTVILNSASGETKAMESTDENSVQLVIDAIKQAIIDGKVQKVEDVTSDSEVSASHDVLQKLQALKNLLDSGLITTQEYDAKKVEILSKM